MLVVTDLTYLLLVSNCVMHQHRLTSSLAKYLYVNSGACTHHEIILSSAINPVQHRQTGNIHYS